MSDSLKFVLIWSAQKKDEAMSSFWNELCSTDISNTQVNLAEQESESNPVEILISPKYIIQYFSWIYSSFWPPSLLCSIDPLDLGVRLVDCTISTLLEMCCLSFCSTKKKRVTQIFWDWLFFPVQFMMIFGLCLFLVPYFSLLSHINSMDVLQLE